MLLVYTCSIQRCKTVQYLNYEYIEFTMVAHIIVFFLTILWTHLIVNVLFKISTFRYYLEYIIYMKNVLKEQNVLK